MQPPLKNPALFGLLFPWLYPYGRRFFSLNMGKKKLRSPEEADWPVVTIKSYAKLVLESCDRRWALDIPFIAFLYDLLLKERLYSSTMRTVAPSRRGRPTRVRDVLTQKGPYRLGKRHNTVGK
ncbi:hypothetical protein B0O80DRAFT_427598 [Mortierella sp. GBAus27b]|nr:hypothetical protein B0O80DRAFT_427598 [Mortierella sp. GBAus27b]